MISVDHLPVLAVFPANWSPAHPGAFVRKAAPLSQGTAVDVD
jgi:hypothetical protein